MQIRQSALSSRTVWGVAITAIVITGSVGAAASNNAEDSEVRTAEEATVAVSESTSNLPASLPTFPPDHFSGDQICGGVLLGKLRISLSAAGLPSGETVPPNPAKPPYSLVWPAGFALHQAASGPEIIGSGGLIIRDGTVLRDVGVCGDGTGTTLFIVEPGQIEVP